MRNIIILMVAFICVSGCDQISSPKNYDDCILKNMKGVSSKAGVFQIRKSCRKKFPEGSEYKYRERELESSEVMLLTGQAGLNHFGNSYSVSHNRYMGNIYNGNENTTVTSVKIEVTATNGDQTTAREYQVNINIPPLTTSDFGFDIIIDDNGYVSSWNIVGGKGFE